MDSFIGWIGGKRLLRGEIVSRFPTDSRKYVEVFGGAAWVLFARDRHAETEIYNDLNGELVNLFRIVKHHPAALEIEMADLLNSREEFARFMRQEPPELTEIQRAARYLYIIRASYGDNARDWARSGRVLLRDGGFQKAADRLKRVAIERMSFDELIPKADGLGTLFYCDPPYVGSEREYKGGGKIFDKTDHIRLAEILRGIRGRFVLSYNECGFVRELYEGFVVESVSRHSNLTGRYEAGKSFNELIIRNFTTEGATP